MAEIAHRGVCSGHFRISPRRPITTTLLEPAVMRTWRYASLSFVAALGLSAAVPCCLADDSSKSLTRMVETEVVDAGIKNPRVIAAMRQTPRQEFVPPALALRPTLTWPCRLATGSRFRRRLWSPT